MEVNRNIAYIKDAEGVTMAVGESSIKGEVVHHYPQFKQLANTLSELEKDIHREDDVWVLSYPKSGSHWTYEITGILLSGNLKPLKMFKTASMIELVPDYASRIRDKPSPRLIDTHIRRKYLPQTVTEKSKILCVVRNPKSVAISSYFQYSQMKENDYNGTFAGYLPLYLKGVDNLFGSWYDYNLDIWDTLHGKNNVLFLFYEEMKEDPVGNIKKISNFLGLDRDHEFCEEVAKLTSFNTMVTHVGKDEGMKKHVSALWKDGTNKFFRKGIVDDWKNHLTVAQNAVFDDVHDEKMKHHPILKSKVRFE